MWLMSGFPHASYPRHGVAEAAIRLSAFMYGIVQFSVLHISGGHLFQQTQMQYFLSNNKKVSFQVVFWTILPISQLRMYFHFNDSDACNTYSMATGCEYSFEMVNSTDEFCLRSPLVQMTVRTNCSFTSIVSVVKASLPLSAAFTRPGPCLQWENKDYKCIYTAKRTENSLTFYTNHLLGFHISWPLPILHFCKFSGRQSLYSRLKTHTLRKRHQNKVNNMQNHQITIKKKWIKRSEVNVVCKAISVYSLLSTMLKSLCFEPILYFSSGLISPQSWSRIENLKQPPRSSGWEDKSEFVMGSWAAAESRLSFSWLFLQEKSNVIPWKQ